MSDNGLDYTLAVTIDADTPARLKALGNPLRALLLDLVLERAMSVTELAERVRRPRGSVAHHVDVLVDAGLLQVVSTRRVRAIDERMYGRTAETIVFPAGAHEGDLPFFADARAEAAMDVMSAEQTGGFTFRHARISADAAAEYNDRLQALAIEFAHHPRSGDQEYALLLAVFPTNRPVAPPAGAE
jgi:DNA-binding transcriptional ArsR family regulator